MSRNAALSLLILAIGCTVCQAATRTYYIQAEKQWWHFAEDSEDGLYIDRCTGRNYSDGAELYMQVGVGSTYYHARYVRYMDANFTTKYEIPDDELHLNIVGPFLRVVEGDTLEVVFRNTLEFETNLVPLGVIHTEDDVAGVASNETKTYSWNITSDLAPGAGSATGSKIWLYRPWIDTTVQENMGLVGPMIVTRKDTADPDTAKPTDVDIEFFLMFHVFDENTNLYFNETLEFYDMLENFLEISNVTEAMWEEANLMHSINGKMFCWNQNFTIPANKSARWHTAVIGGEADIHNFHWHGMVLNASGQYVDQVSLFSGNSWTGDMVTDNPGTWLIHCHVNDHIHAGMSGLYTLEGDIVYGKDQGDVIQYYIAANEVEWDYAPYGMDMCGAEPAEFSEDAVANLVPNNYTLTIGNKQMKAIFEEYTDETFTTKKEKDPSLGLLGPTLRAKVGDTIKIAFKNNCKFTTSLHPHGVFYDKASEGSPYDDGTDAALKMDDHVQQGTVHPYAWYVTERAAPGPADGSSVMWMYHSHTHEIQDSYAGLMGGIIVTHKDKATADNRPIDIDVEYVVSFSILNEQASFMLRDNLAKYLPSVPQLQYSTLAGTITSFQDAENYHVINGYVFCNGPSFNASTGDRVRFYIQSLGTEADLHTPSSTLQWTARNHRASALTNLAGQMQTADITPLVAGEFHVQCRTAEHVDLGMKAKFVVTDSGKDLLSSENGTTRTYYIATDEVEWDYIPSDNDKCTGEDFDEETSAAWGDGTMGKKFIKAVYRQYTDDSFTEQVPQPNPALGMAGPTIYAEVGDVINVVFKNNASFPNNLQLTGGFIPLHNESIIDEPVEAGETQEYNWLVQASNGPAENDISTVAYVYGSNADPTADLNAGLFGVAVIASPGELGEDDIPTSVDLDLPLFFFTLDEASSSLFDDNLKATNFTVPDEDEEYDDYTAWQPTTVFQTLNGYTWCNLPDVELNVTQTVRWYLVGLGGQAGLHTPVFENGILVSRGSPVLTENVAPTVSVAVDMKANVAGEWLYWDDVQEHQEGGMMAKYVVSDPNNPSREGANSN